MRDDPEFCDVTLVWEKELEFEAHRILLANSNTCFNTFLKSQTPPFIDFFERAIFFSRFYGVKCIDLLERYIW